MHSCFRRYIFYDIYLISLEFFIGMRKRIKAEKEKEIIRIFILKFSLPVHKICKSLLEAATKLDDISGISFIKRYADFRLNPILIPRYHFKHIWLS